MFYLFVGVVVVIILVFLGTKSSKPTLISLPSLGILDLTGGSDAGIAQSDGKALSDLFVSTSFSTSKPPLCTVLFVYCRLDQKGDVPGVFPSSIYEIIRDSDALIAVIASEHSGEHYVKAMGGKQPLSPVNLVLTITRKDTAFVQFFRQLFGKMKQGTGMPIAWHELAPQIPGAPEHDQIPGMVCVMGAGQIAFK